MCFFELKKKKIKNKVNFRKCRIVPVSSPWVSEDVSYSASCNNCSVIIFTITAEIHARSLANFYCQYADRHMNLKFMRRLSEREPAIRQFVIVKNKLMSVFNASVLLLIMNFVITLSK